MKAWASWLLGLVQIIFLFGTPFYPENKGSQVTPSPAFAWKWVSFSDQSSMRFLKKGKKIPLNSVFPRTDHSALSKTVRKLLFPLSTLTSLLLSYWEIVFLMLLGLANKLGSTQKTPPLPWNTARGAKENNINFISLPPKFTFFRFKEPCKPSQNSCYSGLVLLEWPSDITESNWRCHTGWPGSRLSSRLPRSSHRAALPTDFPRAALTFGGSGLQLH